MKIDQNTTIANKQFGIILLQGEPTITGQIEARKLALKNCMEDYKEAKESFDWDAEWYESSTLKGWIESHENQIKLMESLIK